MSKFSIHLQAFHGVRVLPPLSPPLVSPSCSGSGRTSSRRQMLSWPTASLRLCVRHSPHLQKITNLGLITVVSQDAPATLLAFGISVPCALFRVCSTSGT